MENLRVNLERTQASLEPGRTIMLRLDTNEKQVDHLRELVEQRLVCGPRGSER
jgi:predicted DNA-binding protein with PD1-like motif